MGTTPSAKIKPSQSQLEKDKKQQKLVPIDLNPKPISVEPINHPHYENAKPDLQRIESITVNTYENGEQVVLSDRDRSNMTMELGRREQPTGLRDSVQTLFGKHSESKRAVTNSASQAANSVRRATSEAQTENNKIDGSSIEADE